MKVICGQAPAIPWWRLQSMTDADIAQHNRKYLMEVEVKYDIDKPFVPLTEREAAIHNYAYEKAWNSAIDAALEKLNESPDPGINYWIEQIRKLKK